MEKFKTAKQVAQHFSVFCDGLQRKKFEELMEAAIEDVSCRIELQRAVKNIRQMIERTTTGNLAHSKGNLLQGINYIETLLK